MTIAYVQFTDTTETVVCSVYGCPQDPVEHPNQATIDSSDVRYQTFINPTSTFQGGVAANEIAIQAALDANAQTQGYLDIKSACAYASPTPFTAATGATAAQIALMAQQELYRHQGNAAQQWMSLTWATAYAYIATVQAGTNPMPTAAEAVAMMPQMVWPAS
jgi:hypothetical protein